MIVPYTGVAWATWSVDPGKDALAVAESIDARLLAVGFTGADGSAPVYSPTSAPKRLVVEKMRLHASGYRSIQELLAKANDLLGVEGAAREFIGAVRALNPRVEVVRRTAPEWKRTTDKVVHHNRIWGVLTPAEREVFARGARLSVEKIEAKLKAAQHQLAIGKRPSYSWAAHNLFDAVGIFLHDVGRITETGMPK